MRRVGGHKPGLEVAFVPSAFGNREDPQPVTVYYTAPTEAERRALRRNDALGTFTLDRATGKPEVDAAGKIKVALTPPDRAADRQRAIGRVTRVENYAGADGVAIADAQRLWTHGETEIVEEVADEILTSHGLREDEKKSSADSSA